MGFYAAVVRPAAFRFDAERVHEIGISLIARGLTPASELSDPRLEQTLFGVHFRNPIGLAAGFDKNAVAVDQWHRLGFGFAEIGTVTWHPQPGNPRPRLFRLPQDQAIVNRMGFNNEGAEAVSMRLAASKPRVPIGINLGKSKITPLRNAAEDYRDSMRVLLPYGAYFVVNVSSPNTPGLRSLQERGPLLEILTALREVGPDVPLFVKVAPDLEAEALDDVAAAAHEAKLTGIVATNTTLSREGLTKDPGEAGGLSGSPLRNRADAVLQHLARVIDPSLRLIGVGGVMTGEDVYRKLQLGADLCQIYTGFVYGGPKTVTTMLAGLLVCMERDGVLQMSEIRPPSGQ